MNYCKISLKVLTGKEPVAGYRTTEFKKLFGGTRMDPRLPFSRTDFFQDSRRYSRGMSISGVQQKLSLNVGDKHHLAITVEGGEFILKPSPEAYPYAAENEHAAMQMSRLLGIDTALCGLVSFREGELAYLTRRFDRRKGGGKLHQEDLLQCLDLPGENKYAKTYEEAGRVIAKVTNGKQAVVMDFIRRVMFAYVIGNDDFHLKNISVQRLPGNTSRYYDRLTPNYDSLFCDVFREGDAEGVGLLALGLLLDPEDGDEYFTDAYNRYGYYTGGDFLELARRLGLREKPVHTFMEKLKNDQKKMTDMIGHSYMPKEMKSRASTMVVERIRALQIVG